MMVDFILGLVVGVWLSWVVRYYKPSTPAPTPAPHEEQERHATATRLSVTWEDIQDADTAVAQLKKDVGL